MVEIKKTKLNKRILIIPALGGLVVLGVLLTVGGFVFAASQEAHDAFCASCHTQPESTYYLHTTTIPRIDLASYHTTQATRCIDCHSGQGISGRISAELLGARNALLWYTGKAVQPAVLRVPIGDTNCLKCHSQVTQQSFTPKEQITVPSLGGGGRGEEGRNNHWHAFLARWQAADPNAGACVSCHGGHTAGGTAQTGFMNVQTVQQVCDACHRVLRTEN